MRDGRQMTPGRCIAAQAMVAIVSTILPKPADAGVYPDTADRLWPSNVVPFVYTSDVTATQRACVQAAMNVWAAVANVSFVVRTTETDFLRVRNGTTGPSFPPPEGYDAGSGAHILNLNRWCSGMRCSNLNGRECLTNTDCLDNGVCTDGTCVGGSLNGTLCNTDADCNNDGMCQIFSNCTDATCCTKVFGLVHEIGHALGLYHSHQRNDRDSYITVNWCQIATGLGNYCKGSDSFAWPRDTMDVDSIMSYPLCVFSVCADTSGGGVCPSLPASCPGGCPDCPDLSSCSAPPKQCSQNCNDDATSIGQCSDLTLIAPYDRMCVEGKNDGIACSDNSDCPGGACQDTPLACRSQFGVTTQCPASGDRVQCVGQRNHLSKWDALLISFLYPQADWRFVEKPSLVGTESGTFHEPYTAFTTGEENTPAGGILWVQPAHYSALGLYSKAMTIRAPLGGVTLGN